MGQGGYHAGNEIRFEAAPSTKRNRVVLHNRLALKKRVYEASDWDSFRKAVEAHKAYGDYLVIQK